MRKLGIFFAILSLLLITIGLEKTFTGAAIGTISSISWLFYLGLILMIFAALLMQTKKSLDVIIIPTGSGDEDRIRTEKALKYYDTQGAKKILISGEVNKDAPLRESQRYGIYKYLRGGENSQEPYKIKPSEMKVSGGKNSLENVMYAIPKLENAREIGIVSYPQHLKRFKYIVKKAKEEGRIPEEMKFSYIPTRQTFKEWAYGILGRIEDWYNLRRGIDEAMKKKEGFIRRILKKIIGGN